MYGSGEFRYQLVEGWAKLPRWWEFGQVPGVATNSEGLVYVLSRSQHPVTIFDRDGNFVSSWGEGQIRRPHGIFIAPDDTVYLADDFSQIILRYTPDGQLLQTIGERDRPQATFYGRPFNLPTKAVLSPSGYLYVSDGYGNRRVHKFALDGTLLLSWGEPGQGPGQFALVHSVAVDSEGRVYVCDRENDRVQIFDEEGQFLHEWADLTRPMDIFLASDGLLYLIETKGRKPPFPPPKVSVWTRDGQMLSRWEVDDVNILNGAHGVTVDSCGDIYVGEALGSRLQKFARVR